MAQATTGNTIELVGNDYPFFKYVSGPRDGFDLRYNPVGPGQAFKAVLDNTKAQLKVKPKEYQK